jgi:hypothetical protein
MASYICLEKTEPARGPALWNLVTKNDEDNDDHNRDEDQNEGVLDHALAFLVFVTMHELAQLYVQAGKQINSTSFPTRIAHSADPASSLGLIL